MRKIFKSIGVSLDNVGPAASPAGGNTAGRGRDTDLNRFVTALKALFVHLKCPFTVSIFPASTPAQLAHES